MNRRNAIEAAFRRLPLLKDKESLLQGAVDNLATIDCTGPGVIPAKFKVVGRTRTMNELDKLAKLSEGLAEHIEALHEPAILAWADTEFSRVRLELPASLRDIAIRARKAKTSIVPESPPAGKPTDARAHAVATMIEYYYQMLTGKKPTRQFDPYEEKPAIKGPFISLLDEVFKILNLPANTDHIARKVIEKLPKSRRKPSNGKGH